ncbi:hypothetical protein KKY_2457 [Pelagibacterium halotolerans B2]|uniref:Uncharacterized protein n=1 Tax=Pelagibacterium halotolerans (strain DSM 22347 / JCM 15775 / CGMCC 1.7692 / B2) TaxID=1082931 RepID=G4R985_PELHB|nr:hypothetical protein KKY_2457 [Pelagibacterium halotolerans B2]
MAVGFVAVTTLIFAALAGMAIGIPLELVVPAVMLAVSPGLGALGAAACYRIYKGVSRPSWAFVFAGAGLLNVVIWIIVGLFPTDPPADAVTRAKEYVDLVELLPHVTLAIAILWSMCGAVFSWLDARMVASEKQS